MNHTETAELRSILKSLGVDREYISDVWTTTPDQVLANFKMILDFEAEKQGALILQDLVDQFRMLQELYPHIQHANLIIEGGRGTGSLLRNIVKIVFPEALYVSMDLGNWHGDKVLKEIDDEVLRRLLRDDELFAPGEKGFTVSSIRANCFNHEIVEQLKKRAGRKNALLVSINALHALTDPTSFGPNSSDYKHPEDRQKVPQWFERSPYQTHIHLHKERIRGSYLAHDNPDLPDPFFDYDPVIFAAQSADWKIKVTDNGVAFINPN